MNIHINNMRGDIAVLMTYRRGGRKTGLKELLERGKFLRLREPGCGSI